MTKPLNLSNLLTPPRFERRDDSRSALILHWILVGSALILVPLIVSVPLVSAQANLVWALQLPMLVIVLVGFALLRHGHLRLVCLVFTLAVWLVASIAAALFGGIRAPAVISFPLLVLITGFLMGRAPAIASATFGVLFALGLIWAANQGWLPDNPQTPTRLWTALAATLAATTALMYLGLLVEEQGRLADDRLRLALAAADVGTWEWDIKSSTVRWSDNVEGIFGLPEGTFAGTYEAYLALIHPGDRAHLETRVQQALQTGEVYEVEHRITLPDGSTRWLSGRGEVTVTASGKPVRMAGAVMDITPRKLVEETLRRSERRLTDAQRVAQLGSWEWDIASDTVEWSDELYRIFGLTRDQFAASYQGFREHTHPDDREYVDEAIREALSTGTNLDYHVRIVRPDGTVRVLHVNGEVVREGTGTPTRMLGTALDVTELKQTERELRRQVHGNEQILRTTMDAYILADSQGRILKVNPACCELTRYSHDGLLNMRIQQLDAGVTPDRLEDRVRQVFDEGSDRFETRIGRQDGELIDVDVSIVVMDTDEGPAIAAFMRDTTERRAAERALSSANRALRVIGECSKAMAHATNEQELLLNVCETLVREGGYRLAWVGVAEEEAMRVLPVAQAGFEQGYLESIEVTWADNERGRGPTGTAIRTGRPSICQNILTDPAFAPWRTEATTRGYQASIALPMQFGDGSRAALNIYASEPDAFDDGAVGLLQDLSHDIAWGIETLRVRGERRETEEALRLSEERYRTLFQTMAQGVVYQDADGRITSANPAAESILGLSIDQMQGRTSMDPRWRAIHRDGSPFPGDQHPSMVALRTGQKVHDQIMGVFHPARNEYRWIMVNAVPQFRLGDERPVEVYTTFDDLTERMRAEQALKEREELYRTLFENSPVGIGLADQHGNILAFNHAMLAPGGYSQDDIAQIGNVARLYHDPLQRERSLALVREQGRLHQHEVQFKRKDGTPYDATLSLTPVTIERKPRMLAIVQDLTERRRAEEQSVALGRILDDSLNEIYVFDATSLRFVQVNKGARGNIGYSMDELSQLTPLDLKPRFTRESFAELLEPLRAGERDIIGFTTVHRRKDGSLYDVEVHLQLSTLRARDVFVAIILDITERKRAEDALRESEARFRRLADNAPAIIYRFAFVPEPHFDYISPAVTQVAGHTPEEYYDDPSLGMQIIHPDDRTRLQVLYEGTVPEGPHTVRWLRPDGSIVWTEDRAVPIYDEGGRLVAIEGIALDITKRKRAEDDLRQSFEQRSLILSQIDEVVYFVRLTDDPVTSPTEFVSDRVQSILGFRPDEFYRDPALFQRTIHPDDRPTIAASTGQIFETGAVGTREFRVRHKTTGEYRWFEDRVVPQFDEQNQPVGFLGVARDVTDRKLAEAELRSSREQLRQLARRLDAVREEQSAAIAREIHDELGQALTGLKIDLSWLKGRLPRDDDMLGRMDSMSDLIDSTVETVRRISTELRPDMLDNLGLAAAVEWYVDRFAQRTGITCVVSVPEEPLSIDSARAITLFRILQEALTNVARHAAANRVDVELVVRDARLLLQIRDDGAGIESLEVASVSSLGLVGMRERAIALGGEFSIVGSPKQGTTVRVRLPIRASGETRLET